VQRLAEEDHVVCALPSSAPKTEREHDRVIARRQDVLGRMIDRFPVPSGEPLEHNGQQVLAVGRTPNSRLR
jgi:hypothetical protein